MPTKSTTTPALAWQTASARAKPSWSRKCSIPAAAFRKRSCPKSSIPSDLNANEVDHDAGSRLADRFRAGETIVVAEVLDTGGGIPEEKLSQIFDPFRSECQRSRPRRRLSPGRPLPRGRNHRGRGSARYRRRHSGREAVPNLRSL